MQIEHFIGMGNERLLSGNVGEAHSQTYFYAVDAAGAVVGALVLVGVASFFGAGIGGKIGVGVLGAVAGAITAEFMAGAPLP